MKWQLQVQTLNGWQTCREYNDLAECKEFYEIFVKGHTGHKYRIVEITVWCHN